MTVSIGNRDRTDLHTGNSSLILGDQDSPVNQSCDMWEGDGSEVENAEPGLVLGRLMLTRGRQESLEAGSHSLSTISVMRIMKMHEGPGLKIGVSMP